MPHRFSVAITGLGCVSPLGCEVRETEAALRRGQDGIREVGLFSTERFRSSSAGLVPPEVSARAGAIFSNSKTWSRAAQMLLVATDAALAGRRDFSPEIVVTATTSGGMDFGEKFFRGLSGEMSPRTARRWVRSYVPHQPALDVMEFYGFRAPLRVVSNACASGTNALGLAAQLVRSGAARRVLAIGFDALAEMVFAGFDSLQASSPEKCRPFDQGRTGLALGEGAAVFVVERGEEAKDRLAIVRGYGCANDNFHLTKPEPGGAGPRLSMQRALADGECDPAEIDYINAHGTGTPFNDASEAAAVRDVCPGVPLSSTKGMTGHALGAAGAIEAAFCILSMQGGFLPPNINLQNPEPDLNLVPTARAGDLRHVLSNSFGFGGSNATILLKRGDA